jgi:hypothetical protein
MPGQREGVSSHLRAVNWGQLRRSRVFPGEDCQLRVLREWLRGLLPACMVRDDVIAVASELRANAICHTASGRGGQFSVEVTRTDSVVSARCEGHRRRERTVRTGRRGVDGRPRVQPRELTWHRETTADLRLLQGRPV